MIWSSAPDVSVDLMCLYRNTPKWNINKMKVWKYTKIASYLTKVCLPASYAAYRIEGNFGAAKIWRNWRFTKIRQIFTIQIFTHLYSLTWISDKSIGRYFLGTCPTTCSWGSWHRWPLAIDSYGLAIYRVNFPLLVHNYKVAKPHLQKDYSLYSW